MEMRRAVTIDCHINHLWKMLRKSSLSLSLHCEITSVERITRLSWWNSWGIGHHHRHHQPFQCKARFNRWKKKTSANERDINLNIHIIYLKCSALLCFVLPYLAVYAEHFSIISDGLSSHLSSTDTYTFSLAEINSIEHITSFGHKN